MRIYLKIINENNNSTVKNVNNTNTNTTNTNSKELQYKRIIKQGKGKILNDEDIHHIHLMKTLNYLFSNRFKVESNILIDDLIDVPNNTPITFELLEEKYIGWCSYTLNKRLDENRLPYYLVESIIQSTKSEWCSFLPILNELEKTHILYCNIILYMIVDYSTKEYTMKIEHFMDFKKKKKDNNNDDEDCINQDFKLEDLKFFTLQQVKEYLMKDLPKTFSDLIIHCKNRQGISID